jgi:hypothetical protein
MQHAAPPRLPPPTVRRHSQPPRRARQVVNFPQAFTRGLGSPHRPIDLTRGRPRSVDGPVVRTGWPPSADERRPTCRCGLRRARPLPSRPWSGGRLASPPRHGGGQ